MEMATTTATKNFLHIQMIRYSRTSIARILMARLPYMFELVLESLEKNPIALDNVIIYIHFPFYIENGILFVLI